MIIYRSKSAENLESYVCYREFWWERFWLVVSDEMLPEVKTYFPDFVPVPSAFDWIRNTQLLSHRWLFYPTHLVYVWRLRSYRLAYWFYKRGWYEKEEGVLLEWYWPIRLFRKKK
jgi:hypothetical protein